MAEKVGPTGLGKFVGFLFIVGCIVAAGYMFRDTLFPSAKKKLIDMNAFKGNGVWRHLTKMVLQQ
jgi:hypothetical protein